MPAKINLLGQTFGKLIVIKEANSKGGKTYWLCQCECGKIKEVQTCHLRSGKITSCGGCKSKIRFCLNCNKQLNKNQNKYCSIKCQRQYERENYIDNCNKGTVSGLKKSGSSYKISDNIRTYLLQKTGYKCELCGWDKINPITLKCPLEIHHKDGDKTNNKEENLQVLCPNCHSLTSNYKYLNSKNYKQNNN